MRRILVCLVSWGILTALISGWALSSLVGQLLRSRFGGLAHTNLFSGWVLSSLATTWQCEVAAPWLLLLVGEPRFSV